MLSPVNDECSLRLCLGKYLSPSGVVQQCKLALIFVVDLLLNLLSYANSDRICEMHMSRKTFT